MKKILLFAVIVIVSFSSYSQSYSHIKELETKAKEGDAQALYELGNFCYEEDILSKAFKYYKKAAKLGNVDAMAQLARIYFGEYYRKLNYRKALKWYRKAAEGGNTEAMIMLGEIYTTGLIVEQDTVEGLKWYRKALELGEVEVNRFLASFYENGRFLKRDTSLAIKLYIKAAEQEDERSQLRLGDYYKEGILVEKDHDKAVYWYKKASENKSIFQNSYSRSQIEELKRKAGEGDASATYELGNLYSDYWYTMCEGFKFYKKAAELGNESAKQRMYDFFHKYEQCSSCMVKDDELFNWYRDAAELGNSDAMIALGYIYMYRDDVVERDTTESLKWYKIAAENGHGFTAERLFRLYSGGVYVEQSDSEAFKWLKKSVENGRLSYELLGDYYYRGNGVEKNYAEAMKCYKEDLKNHKDPYVMYKLGIMYMNGEGVEVDYNEALKWFNEALEIFSINVMYDDDYRFIYNDNYKTKVKMTKKKIKELKKKMKE